MNKRPPRLKPPTYLAKNVPVPKPQPIVATAEFGGKDGLEPTRYGDWEAKGICWDF